MLGAHVQPCCAATRRAEKSDTGDCCGRTRLFMFRLSCRLMGDARSSIDLLEPDSDLLLTYFTYYRPARAPYEFLRIRQKA